MKTTISDDLARVKDAILHVRAVQEVMDHPACAALLAALAERRDELEMRVEEQRAALGGTGILRPTFRVRGKPSFRMTSVVFRPKPGETLPYLTEDGYAMLKRLLCTDKDNLEVLAKYEVAVRSKYGELVAVISTAE